MTDGPRHQTLDPKPLNPSMPSAHLQHGHDDGDAEQGEHDGAGHVARLVGLLFRLVRALAAAVRAQRCPGVRLACGEQRRAG